MKTKAKVKDWEALIEKFWHDFYYIDGMRIHVKLRKEMRELARRIQRQHKEFVK